MANGFWSNGTFSQIEHKKLTSLVKMANVFLVKWDILCLSRTYPYLPFTIFQPTYLLNNPPTYLNVIPTYQPTHPPT
jgi:hypothetical protein